MSYEDPLQAELLSVCITGGPKFATPHSDNKVNMHRISTTSLLLILASVSGLQGCTSTGSRGLLKLTPSNEAAALSKEMVTIENLLRWPLEGTAGTEKTIAALDQVFNLEEPWSLQLFGDDPVSLKDGYVLSFVRIGQNSKDIDIGLAQEPCFAPEHAVAITGATLSPVTQDAHGVDRGRTYDITQNGTWISFTTTPTTYRCVDSIHIHKAIERAGI